jgi:hypothetical protein
MKTIYQKLLEVIPASEMHNHYSDLYVPVNKVTKAVIQAYIDDNETLMTVWPETFQSQNERANNELLLYR